MNLRCLRARARRGARARRRASGRRSAARAVVAQEVGARVADVAERRPCRRARRARRSSSCPCRRSSASVDARSCTRRFASWISSTTRASPPRSRRDSSSALGRERRGDLAGLRAAHAVGDREERRRARRTSPRCAGACGPVSVSPALPARSRVSALMARTSGRSRRSRTTSPGASLRSRVSADAVHERAVRRADVLDVDAVAPRLEPRVPRRGVLVLRQRDVVRRRRAPTVSACESSESTSPSLERRAREHDEPARARAPRGWASRPAAAACCGAEDHRLLRQPQVARGRAHDPPDEEVEQDEERELQDEQRRLDLRRGEHRYCSSRAKTISVEPIVKRVPSSSFSRFTRLPLTSTPFVESRSTSQYGGAFLAQLRVAPRDVRVGDLDVGVLRAADHDAPLRDLVPLPVPGEDCDLALDAELDRRGRLGRLQRRGGGLVDHRRPVLRLGRGVARSGRVCTMRVAIPKTPTSRSSSVSSWTTRRCQQGVALAPRVLGEVVGELVAQLLLVARELLAVCRARGRSCTRSARRPATPRRCGGRPSP